MPKKKDFMGRSNQEEYDLAEGYMNAPMARDVGERRRKMQQSVQDIEEEQKARKQQMDESIQNMKDEMRYQSNIDLREAMRKARQEEYKKRGF